jgi:hypothetical protein
MEPPPVMVHAYFQQPHLHYARWSIPGLDAHAVLLAPSPLTYAIRSFQEPDSRYPKDYIPFPPDIPFV